MRKKLLEPNEFDLLPPLSSRYHGTIFFLTVLFRYQIKSLDIIQGEKFSCVNYDLNHYSCNRILPFQFQKVA